jgi:hypothetical protein
MAAALLDYASGAIALPNMEHVAPPGGLAPDLAQPVVIALWVASIGFYALSAFLLAAHNRICAGLYVAALACNMGLFLLERPAMNSPLFLPLAGGLGVIGLMMLASGGKNGAWAAHG